MFASLFFLHEGKAMAPGRMPTIFSLPAMAIILVLVHEIAWQVHFIEV